MQVKKGYIPVIIIALVLFFDQFIKIWVKTNMTLGESISVFGDWFVLHFTENPGMAFGLQFAGEHGKIILSLFRIAAVIFISWYLYRLIAKDANKLLITCISLILAGAIGNIIDSAFYGLIFSESTFFSVAEFMPEEGGYAAFLHGNVVDMLRFWLIDTTLPEWVPIRGGQRFIFFKPVFNIADAAITTGALILLVFQRKIFANGKKRKKS